MKPYIITHMMTSVDGRIDCPMVAQLGGDEYYVALDRLGKTSKLSGRVTSVLENPAVKGERTIDNNGEAPIGGGLQRGREGRRILNHRGHARPHPVAS